MGTILYAIVCSILMVVGLIGVVLPGLPGVPLAWLGLFIYALGTGFDRISIITTVVFFIVMLFTLSLDFLAPILGAKKYKASKYGLIGAFLGFDTRRRRWWRQRHGSGSRGQVTPWARNSVTCGLTSGNSVT